MIDKFFRFSLPTLLLLAGVRVSAEMEVVQSVSRDFQTSLGAHATVRVVTREQIKAFHYKTLADVLEDQVGFFVSRNFESNVGVRGYSALGDFNSRILVLYDNHPLTGLEDRSHPIGAFGAINAFSMSLDGIEQIEIIRGPGFRLYGSGAMLAVVNLIPVSREAEVPKLRGSVELGSEGAEEYVAQGSLGGESGRLSLEYLNRSRRGPTVHYEEFEEALGEEHRIEGLADGQSESLLMRADWSDFTLSGYMARTRVGDPSAPFFTQPGEPQVNRNQRAFVNLQYLTDLTDSLRFWAKAGWDAYRYVGDYLYEDEEMTFGVFDERDMAKNQWLTADAQLDWFAPYEQVITLGVRYENRFHLFQENLEKTEEGTFYRNQEEGTTLSVFAQDEWAILSSLSVNLHARFDYDDAFGGLFSPRASLVYLASDALSIKALYGKGYRAPSNYERFYSDSFQYFGNPDLEPEIVESAELTVEWMGEKLSMQAGLFYNGLEDLIVQVERDPRPGDDPDLESILTFENETRLELVGGEFSLRWGTSEAGFLEIGYSGQRGTYEDETLVNSPQHKLNGRLLYRPMENASLAWSARWYGSRISHDGTKIDASDLHDLIAVWGDESQRFTVTAKVANLFDVRIVEPATGDYEQSVLPQSGRTFSVRVGMAF